MGTVPYRRGGVGARRHELPPHRGEDRNFAGLRYGRRAAQRGGAARSLELKAHRAQPVRDYRVLPSRVDHRVSWWGASCLDRAVCPLMSTHT